MVSPIPFFDTAGFLNRTNIPAGDVGIVTTNWPGFLPTTIADEQARITSRLRKRTVTPLGTSQPQLAAQGTNPPPVQLVGSPTVGSNEVVIAVTTPGALGTALFQWSTDGGNTWQATNVTTAASVPLAGTGLAAQFPSGMYSTDNTYAAPTPVPREVLRCLAKLVSPAVMRRRGVNEQDAQMVALVQERTEALAELEENADSNTGLWDLPVNDASAASAITQGTPLSYSETSPWEWTDKQARKGEGYDDGCR